MGANWVKVAQQRNLQVLIRNTDILHDLFDKELRGAVWIRGAACRHILLKRNLVVHPVDGRRRTEYDLLDLIFAHEIEQVQCSRDIVVVIFQRLLDRFAHRFKSCKMDHCVDLVLFENLFKVVVIEHITFIAGEGLPCDLLYGTQCVGRGVHIVIHHNNVKTIVEQLHTGVGTDKSGAAGHQYCHNQSSFLVSGRHWTPDTLLRQGRQPPVI